MCFSQFLGWFWQNSFENILLWHYWAKLNQLLQPLPLLKLNITAPTSSQDDYIYCDTFYSKGGVNQICIMKYSKDLLEYTQPMSLSSSNSRNTLIITKTISETDIIKMLDIPIESIFVMLGWCFYQQTIVIPMGTNCAPSLAYLFIYSYDAEHIQGLLKKNDELARSFNISLLYIGDVFSQNYSRFDDFVYRFYPIVLEIKDTIYKTMSASCLDLHLEIDNGD